MANSEHNINHNYTKISVHKISALTFGFNIFALRSEYSTRYQISESGPTPTESLVDIRTFDLIMHSFHDNDVH